MYRGSTSAWFLVDHGYPAKVSYRDTGAGRSGAPRGAGRGCLNDCFSRGPVATKLVCGVWHLFTGGNRSPVGGGFSMGERREPKQAKEMVEPGETS